MPSTVVSSFDVIAEDDGELTLASIIVLSSQPKLEMIQVRVHTLSRMKNQARARKAMVMRSCCSVDFARSVSLCIMVSRVAGLTWCASDLGLNESTV
jgi:hypothetical protein